MKCMSFVFSYPVHGWFMGVTPPLFTYVYFDIQIYYSYIMDDAEIHKFYLTFLSIGFSWWQFKFVKINLMFLIMSFVVASGFVNEASFKSINRYVLYVLLLFSAWVIRVTTFISIWISIVWSMDMCFFSLKFIFVI